MTEPTDHRREGEQWLADAAATYEDGDYSNALIIEALIGIGHMLGHIADQLGPPHLGITADEADRLKQRLLQLPVHPQQHGRVHPPIEQQPHDQ